MVIFIRENIIILALILILGLYLGIKSFGDGWDGWGFGSAQTLMSSEYWAKDGFIKNYFLFIPRPYSKLIHYFDESEFRNRPIDTVNGEIARDRRLYYTHYPPLYLFPYAVIAKLGIEYRPIYRIFSLLISLTGLLFFYLFIKSISNKTVAILASIYYGFSVTFLNYADSVSIQPWTVLFTFLTLYLSVLSCESFNAPEKYKKYNLYIWFAYLALSLSSYDATFYVFAYLILFDILVLKKFLWKKWSIFALAPILGFALQVIQNTWYLGGQNMINDFYRYYTERAIGSAKNFIIGISAPFVSITGIKTLYFFKKTFVALGSAILIFAILKYFHNSNNGSKSKFGVDYNIFKIIIILAFAAIVQPFFLNVTGLWPYQGVITAPFWGLLIGTASVGLLHYIATLNYYKVRTWFIILFFTVLGLWSVRFYDTLEYVKNWPNNQADKKVIEFSREIKTLYQNEEKIAFRVIPKNPIWKSQFSTFNMEYYMGMPTIDFANTSDLIADFKWLKKRSEYPHYSFIISENKSDVEKISKEIGIIEKIITIQEQSILVIPPQK